MGLASLLLRIFGQTFCRSLVDYHSMLYDNANREQIGGGAISECFLECSYQGGNDDQAHRDTEEEQGQQRKFAGTGKDVFSDEYPEKICCKRHNPDEKEIEREGLFWKRHS